MRVPFIVLCFAAIVSGCAHTLSSGWAELLEAKSASGPSASAAVLARAGAAALLIDDDTPKAAQLFDEALKQAPDSAAALEGRRLTLELRGETAGAFSAALDLIQRAPTHPFATVAARFLLDHAGYSRTTDDDLLTRGAAALKNAPPGDTGALLRSALLSVHAARGDVEASGAARDVGAVQNFALVGPFSAFHQLDFDTRLPLEASGNLSKLSPGPFGELTVRPLHVEDGRFNLEAEPPQGDVYVFATDVTVEQTADFVLRIVSPMDLRASIDGAPVVERRTWLTPAPTVTAVGVTLKKGTHRLLLKVLRGHEGGQLFVTLPRIDGQASNVRSVAASGGPSAWGSDPSTFSPRHVFPTATSLAHAVEREFGGSAAAVLAALDGVGRDRDGARRLLLSVPATPESGFVALVRAVIELGDRSLPPKVSTGRASRHLEAALSKNARLLPALLAQTQLAFEEGRHLEALELARRARATTTPPPVSALMTEARALLALRLDGLAEKAALEAEGRWPTLCEAMALRFDLVRRRDAVSETNALLDALRACPFAARRNADIERARGRSAAAAQAYQALFAQDQTRVTIAREAAVLSAAERKFKDAIAQLEATSALWPRDVTTVKDLATLYERAGRPKDAALAKERASRLDRSDVQLWRAAERARTGKELLSEYAITTKQALDNYKPGPGDEDAPSAYILDAAAIRIADDGAMVDRIHVIQKALDQNGVSEVAEVNIPPGAEVLTLRTLKADGTVLEPESFEDKDTVSLPGVQVGDYVEYEFLQSHAPRGPGMPGATASNFYFQLVKEPNHFSTYVVEAPLNKGLKVDAHNMDVRSAPASSNVEVFRHEERNVPPAIPEPLGPPSPNEYLPFVSVGFGQTGNDGLVSNYADQTLENGRVTADVAAFAQRAAGDARGLPAVERVYRAVMEKLSGRDNGLGGNAAASATQDRGSRLWLLWSSLRSLGFEARLVAVRTTATDPHPYLFPTESLLPYVCLRVRLPEGRYLWLDTVVRFAPFGELPESAAGDLEAYVFPEPGLPLEHVRTPPAAPHRPKEVHLELTLASDGTLSGRGGETYFGQEAAQLGEALDSLPEEQKTQALQGALSRYFGGADLKDLHIKSSHDVGAPLSVEYSLTATRFARKEGDRLVMGPLTFPAQVGRRFIHLARRDTPLFIESTEAAHTVVTVTLPEGLSVAGLQGELKSGGPGAHFGRREVQTGNTLRIEEELSLSSGRIPPDHYEPFVQFAGEVDLIQGRDLVAEPAGSSGVQKN